MNQFINFHQKRISEAGLGKAKDVLTLFAWATIIFGLAFGWLSFQIDDQQTALAKVEKLAKHQQKQLVDLALLTATLSERVDEQGEQAKKVERQIEKDNALLAVLKGRINGENSYLQVLEGLALHGVDGVALNNIELAQGGGILIEGQTTAMTLIPRFALALSEMPVFSEIDFSKMEVNKVSDTEIYFSLRSTAFNSDP